MYGSTLQQLEPGRVYKAVVPQKLPIGGTVKGNKKPGLFKVYVPTRDGATLELKTTAGVLEITGPNGAAVKDATGKVVEGGAKELKVTLPDGAFGWYGVVVRDSASYEVSAKLSISGHAREPNGQPIVPWNFYYFPFKDVQEQGANHPSAKWQKKFGGKANDWERASYWKSRIEGGGTGFGGHAITKEFVAEFNKWAGSEVVNYDNTWWWGHCDAASVASALFQQPKPTADFTEADLEYFATEIAMCGYAIDLKFFLGGLNNTNRNHASHTEKPEDKPGQALDLDIGPLHESIIDVVKKRGSVALIDMRAEWADGKNQSPDVWNQATYKFTMEAKQAVADTGPETEEATARALEWKTVLHANADAHDSKGNPENPAGSGWLRECYYVLHFDAAGKTMNDHPKNNFKKCTWAKTGKEYYAPRYIFEIKGLNQGGGGPGNPQITLGQAQGLGLALRPAFQR